jgi:glucose/mannose-6-phosphate isomerase
MLDDPKYIAQFDHSNALAVIAGQADQLRQQYEFDVPQIEKLQRVVVAGMGGSALAAEFVRSWLGDRLRLPIEIVRDYDLPRYVDDATLTIVSSYSGNTEEALSALQQAKERGAAIAIMTAGGKLAEAAEAYTYLQIPGGLQPRLAVLYGVKAICTLLERLQLAEGLVAELETAAEWLLAEIEPFMPAVSAADNPAKQIAKQLVGHAVVVYGGPTLGMVAMKWKIDFNENAKNLAFWNQLPELNHNEFIGWQHPHPSHLKLVELQSSLDHSRISKRFEVTNKLLSGVMPAPVTVEAHGQTKLQQMLWTLLLGDFTSAYLAFLNQVDPTPVELVEKLKQELG